MKQVEDALESAAAGQTPIRFLDANPGFGKSHFLNVLRFRAAERNAIVSYSSQNISAGITLNNPRAVYRQIVASLQSRGDGAERDLLKDVLAEWTRAALPLVQYSNPNASMLYRLAEADLLPHVSDLHERTGVCLIGLLLAARSRNQAAMKEMVDAFRGSEIQNRQLAWTIEELGGEVGRLGFAPTQYNDPFWFGQLGSVIAIAQRVGYSAAAILLDELESLVALRTSRSRDKAYRVLNAIFVGEYPISGCLLLFAYTPAFLASVHRDFDAYGPDYHDTWTQVVESNTIEIPKLAIQDGYTLVQRLSSLYDRAYETNHGDAIAIESPGLVKVWDRGGRSVRDLVRNTIRLLDEELA